MPMKSHPPSEYLASRLTGCLSTNSWYAPVGGAQADWNANDIVLSSSLISCLSTPWNSHTSHLVPQLSQDQSYQLSCPYFSIRAFDFNLSSLVSLGAGDVVSSSSAGLGNMNWSRPSLLSSSFTIFSILLITEFGPVIET